MEFSHALKLWVFIHGASGDHLFVYAVLCVLRRPLPCRPREVPGCPEEPGPSPAVPSPQGDRPSWSSWRTQARRPPGCCWCCSAEVDCRRIRQVFVTSSAVPIRKRAVVAATSESGGLERVQRLCPRKCRGKVSFCTLLMALDGDTHPERASFQVIGASGGALAARPCLHVTGCTRHALALGSL